MKVRMKISAVLKKDSEPLAPGKVVDLDKDDAMSLIERGIAEPFKREDIGADEKPADDKNKQQ